ncbi:hypothetical protein PRZ48_011020 [Zasmidium cellare]|uniref:Uncharacterized protein n=1 Tax=Zasmidium cellare TaxID=395010 RepID=A0ABR0EA96_ZASCE|nr:hypothetical protein PRZ48_011020 [Zasmidium cellare]
MYTNILALSAALSALAAAHDTQTAPTFLQRRYTPKGPNAQCQYICKDYFDDCGNTYGPGCFSSCPGYPEPTYSTPVCNEAVPTTTAPPQKRYSPPAGQSASCPLLCKDYFDDCGNTFGPGCYSSCPGYPEPTFTTPVCNEAVPTTTAAPDLSKRYTPPPGESASCPFICKDYFDDCGNTYGPGCFSSCPGYPEPTFTTPACNAAEPTA